MNIEVTVHDLDDPSTQRELAVVKQDTRDARRLLGMRSIKPYYDKIQDFARNVLGVNNIELPDLTISDPKLYNAIDSVLDRIKAQYQYLFNPGLECKIYAIYATINGYPYGGVLVFQDL